MHGAPDAANETATKPVKRGLLSRLGLLRRLGRREKAPSTSTGSLTRRMIGVAAVWILILLGVGGYTLDRVLVNAITRNFDAGLEYVLTALIATSEIGSDGDILLNRQPADQRFLEAYSGLYFQISGQGHEPFPSRSLWDRQLVANRPVPEGEVAFADSREFYSAASPEVLRIAERDIRLPGSPVLWRFQVAQNREQLNEQIGVLRRTLVRSFGILALGLIVLAALQAIYGLWPLRRVRRAIVAIGPAPSRASTNACRARSRRSPRK
jgi:hypothetical protein